MNGHSSANGLGPVAQEEEPATGIRGNSDDSPHAQFRVAELVFAPGKAFVGAEQNKIGGRLVVCHDQDGSRVSELPEMGVFVYLLPCEAGISTEECVALVVGC